jgi:hypothetical protein
MAKRRVEITVETERLILRGRKPKACWCEACGALSITVSIAQAAIIARTDELTICRLIESGRLHGFEADGSCLRVCLGSLLGQPLFIQ